MIYNPTVEDSTRLDLRDNSSRLTPYSFCLILAHQHTATVTDKLEHHHQLDQPFFTLRTLSHESYESLRNRSAFSWRDRRTFNDDDHF